jgi:GNAT superfamily N-acetyltransferase
MTNPLTLSSLVKEVLGPEYWYGEGNVVMGDLMTLEKDLLHKYPELEELSLSGKDGRCVSIHSLIVRKEHRSEGIGTKVLTDIKKYATDHKLPIALTPEAEPGKKDALNRFYKSNGFTKAKDAKFTSMFGPVLMWYPQR